MPALAIPPAAPALSRSPTSWQLILADLALILFLMTAAALTGGAEEDSALPPEPSFQPPTPEAVAPAQALYRTGPGLPTLAQWLEQQPRDPRAALTIVARHGPGTADRAWADARAMAATASAMGVRARVIIREGARDDIHASLAYDQPAE
ncbi:MAG: hypothetical protein AAGA34_01735 [Pseudomonadota bacterium]